VPRDRDPLGRNAQPATSHTIQVPPEWPLCSSHLSLHFILIYYFVYL
jgi:hypothetical protein